MQRLTRERLPRFQFGRTKKKKKIEKEENPKKQKKKNPKKQKKKKIQKKNGKRKIKKKIKKIKKEIAFSSPGQNMRILSLPYS